jgi:hypothetical protein
VPRPKRDEFCPSCGRWRIQFSVVTGFCRGCTAELFHAGTTDALGHPVDPGLDSVEMPDADARPAVAHEIDHRQTVTG